MNLLERVLTLLRANLNNVVEKSDDPEKALRQLQLDMRNQLVQVKTQVATAIAESHKLQKRTKERQTEAELWMKKAEQAIQQNNDDAARIALARHNDFTRQVQRYQQQQKEQEQLVTTMRNALRQLEAKLSEVETTIDLLVARKRNALLQQKVFDALNTSANPRDKERTAKAQDAVLEAEARARALADLHQRNLDTQLENLTEEQRIEQQLRNLKRKNTSSQDVPLLAEGNAQPDALLSPQPTLNEPAKASPHTARVSKKREGQEERQDEQRIAHLRKLLETNQQNP
ncbi:MAG TPA: phage shock protein A [Ktedonobacter sp.]|nr:phage shock protein A [Ktedonobacter sp.]